MAFYLRYGRAALSIAVLSALATKAGRSRCYKLIYFIRAFKQQMIEICFTFVTKSPFQT